MPIQEVDEDAEEDAEEVEEVDAFSPIVKMPGEVVEEQIIDEGEEENKVGGLGISSAAGTTTSQGSLDMHHHHVLGGEKLPAVVESAAAGKPVHGG